MKVTNSDIEVIRTCIKLLDSVVLRNTDVGIVQKAINDKIRLVDLKSKLLIEFTKREFPYSNKVT